MNYTRSSNKFAAGGIDLFHPVDATAPGTFPFLMNVRGYQDGRLDKREGLNVINSPIADPINSIYRMNDYVTNSFARFLGAGTKLYFGTTSFASIDTGYSGNPLSFVNYLPLKAVSGRTYVADSVKMSRIKVDGTAQTMGIHPPNIIPSAELIQPAYTTPTGTDATSPFVVSGSWGNSGSSTTPSLNPMTMPGRLVSVTIGTILYISGSTGWACIAPTGGNAYSGPAAIVAGMRLTLGTGGGGTAPPTGNVEYTTVQEVHKVYPASGITVAGIIYDTGTSGLCTIQPSANMSGVTRNTMLEIGSEFVRVVSVTSGNNGVSSFRCSTASTHSSSESITPPASGSIWVYLANTHAAGEYLWQDVYQFEINPGSKGGQGQVYSNAATMSPYTLAIANNRPLTPDDYINLSVWCDHPEYLTQGTLILDVDSGTTNTHATTDGTRNAYIYTFRQADLQQFVANIQTSDAVRPGNIQDLLQADTNLELITPLIPPSPLGSGQTSTPVDVASTAGSVPPVPVLASAASQLYTGASQWTELRIKVSDFIRIGSDQSADFTAIRAIILNFTVSNNIFVSMAGMWSGGTYGPDLGNNPTPFIYRYCYRDSSTGARSLPGPALRSGILAYRQAVQLTGVTSTNSQVDKIDWERLGGANVSAAGQPDWHYLGTCDNSSPTIIDDQFSAAILVNPPLDTDVYQPFTLSGAPVTVQAMVAGSAIQVTTGAISQAMAVGTQVLVGGVLTEVYATPSSTALFHVADSMGNGTNVTVEIQEPILTGQPLPVMWGPFQETLFGCGNDLDAGSLYYTNSEDPDAASDANRLSITSPTESMMNGFVFNSKCYAFSDSRLFEILPTSGPSPFVYNNILNSKGLAARWALAVGPAVWFVSDDGIYEWTGGSLENISNNISPLFPRGDRPGISVNGLAPVNMQGSLRLCYYNSYVIFDYLDASGKACSMVYDTITKSWYPDTYLAGSSAKVICRCAEQSLGASNETFDLLTGTNNGVLYSNGGTSDAGLAIDWEVDTPAMDFGDSRAWKILGDTTVDTNTGGSTISIVPWLNSYTSSVGGFNLSSVQRTVSNPFTFQTDLFVRNVGFKFTGSSSSAVVQLYTLDVSYLIRPEDTNNRVTDWDDAQYKGNKFLQGFLLEANTYGQSRTVYLQVDYNTLPTPFVINHNGQLMKPYTLDPAFTGHLFRIAPEDADEWQLFGVKWVWEPAPEFVTYWETQTTSHDFPGYMFLKDGYIALNSNAPVTLTIVVDGKSTSTILPSTSGQYAKLYVLFNGVTGGSPGLKGKLFKYILSSAQPFQLFQKDSEVRVHSWYGGDFVSRQPFGDISRIAGARI